MQRITLQRLSSLLNYSKQRTYSRIMSLPDSDTVKQVLQNGPYRTEVGGKQLTIAAAGQYSASTTAAAKPLIIWELEKTYYARYYIPQESLHADIKKHLSSSKSQNGVQNDQHAPLKHSVSVELVDTIEAPNTDAKGLVEKVNLGPKTLTWIRFVGGKVDGYIRFERDEIDDWFENGAIFNGIRNPYKRIETGIISNHIIVKIDGEVVAESNVAVLLTETYLKPVYYLPTISLKDYGSVEKTDLRTICPYKGEAAYFSITVKGKKYDNFIWYYPYPTYESKTVEGLISFYNKENVDILVDGVKI